VKLRTVLWILAITSPMALAEENKEVAAVLGWVADPQANLCRGYFSQPQSLLEVHNPAAVTRSPTKISYAGPGVLAQYGQSTVTEHVVVTQPGRIAKADKAVIYRNPQNGRIDYIRLEGNVKVQEYGKLVAGPYCVVRFDQHTLEAGPSVYHLYEDPQQLRYHTLIHPYDAWGTADKTVRDAQGLVHLTNATYTTCAPINPSWQISAGKIVLDQQSGFGTAYHMMLRFYDVPLLYAPVYTFPIDNRRKTGFLTPEISYQDKNKHNGTGNGVSLGLPYYWNLAPNYDLTTTPRIIQTRGFELNSLFRYLAGPQSSGQVYVSLVPYDPAFRQFRQDTLNSPPIAPPDVSLTPYLNDLSGDSDFRGFFHWQEKNQFTDQLSGHLLLNYVTDDYYFQDFGTSYAHLIANQLPNQADMKYQSEHWSVVSLLQGYQTLHIIGQDANPAVDQYSRLPEIDITGDYADLGPGVNFSLSAQSVNFAYDSNYEPTTLEQPIGERLHLRPTLTRPFYTSGGYFTPQIALDSTSYGAQLAASEDGSTRPSFSASRNLPIVDVDSGLYFDRPIRWDQYSYLATLEPRLFYLYVPLQDQNKYPNFDSALLPFTFPQLFDINRFTSYDRLENANQMSFGLTSRVLNSNTTEQKLKMDFGFGYYLQSPQVCLDPTDCNTSTFQYVSPNSHITPLVGQLTYYPWRDWSTTASYAYDSSLGQTNNAQVGIDYNHLQAEVFKLSYLYVREQNGDPQDNFGLSNNTNLISSGVAWPLSEHWSGLAYGAYNISKQRPDTYYGGLQYDSCCWTLRFIASRSFVSQASTDSGKPINQFQNSYYVQLQLKSLGNIGVGPSNLLRNTLSGYADPFK
jgi:LPS-assembly protein